MSEKLPNCVWVDDEIVSGSALCHTDEQHVAGEPYYTAYFSEPVLRALVEKWEADPDIGPDAIIQLRALIEGRTP